MESISQESFDAFVTHTIRIELVNGRVLYYWVSAEEKKRLMEKMNARSDGDEEIIPLNFVWFETALKRQVVINTSDIVKLTFRFDVPGSTSESYFDNFNLMEKETLIENKPIENDKTGWFVTDNEYLPQCIIYHRGLQVNPDDDDGYASNPIVYNELTQESLYRFAMELDDEIPFRQFVSLIDNDGEQSYVPLKQIIVLECDENIMFGDELEEE